MELLLRTGLGRGKAQFSLKQGHPKHFVVYEVNLLELFPGFPRDMVCDPGTAVAHQYPLECSTSQYIFLTVRTDQGATQNACVPDPTRLIMCLGIIITAKLTFPKTTLELTPVSKSLWIFVMFGRVKSGNS